MKLSGIRVVDLSSFLPGPYLTSAMADHGAEVIKIEAPGGDPGRGIGSPDGDSTVFFRNVNRGKKSVVLDLKQDGDREALLRLCETADVVIESFRPGVVARLGVDYEHVKARNPRIVYCSISAFGQHGPYLRRPAHDLAIEAMSGALSITLGNDDVPAIPGIPAADILSGLQGLSAVLMALLRRTETGLGDYIDISMYDSMVSACVNVLGPAMSEGRQQIAKHERTTGGAAFYRIYRTSDDRYLTLAGQEEKFVRNLLNAVGRPDFIDLCLQGPGPHQAPVTAYFDAMFGSKPLAHWIEWLLELDVCFGPVQTFPEMLADPQLRARGMVVTDGAGRKHIASPIKFSDEPAQIDLSIPALGQDTEAVTRGLRPASADGSQAKPSRLGER
jgi:crotonobetainyl-CoA:carnitine CoA-transferase CaiB-like acyl-CoA transferase